MFLGSCAIILQGRMTLRPRTALGIEAKELRIGGAA